MPPPQTYSDTRLDEISRSAFVTALDAGCALINDKDHSFSPDRLSALAAFADAAACGFKEAEETTNDFGERF